MFEKIISEVLHNHYKKQFKEIDKLVEEAFTATEVLVFSRHADKIRWEILELAKKISDEIDLEAVAGGKVTMDLPQLKIWFINGKQINSYFQKYRGKEIEILIKVKE